MVERRRSLVGNLLLNSSTNIRPRNQHNLAQSDDVATPSTVEDVAVSESSNQPDKFGCGAVALVVFMGLMAVALIVLLVMGQDLGNSLQNWLNQQQQQADSGPGDPGDPNADNIPPISNRWYDSGNASTSIGGGPFALNGPIQLDPVASYTNDGLSWISFIDNANPDAGEILIVFGEPENSVTVAHGNTNVIIGNDDECKFDIKVTDGSVSGSVKCAKADVMNGSVPSGETARIDLQFSTATHATQSDGGGDGTDPGTGDPTPADGG